LFEFKAVAQSGCLVLEGYSDSRGKASAYLPVIVKGGASSDRQFKSAAVKLSVRM
jgi:hypothetical protein